MNLTIQRLAEKDAIPVSAFLDKLYKEDVESGGTQAPTSDVLTSQARDNVRTWVAISDGKVVGVLGPEARGVRTTEDRKERTFHNFRLLAVDYGIYSTSVKDAIQIARELTLFAADEIRDEGALLDDIRIEGPTNSRGASWARLLGCKETAYKGYSEFWLETSLIWERCKATE